VWVASGVVEEKSSRVVEVLLSTIRPRELLAGKVIGLGLLGLGQLLLIAAIGLGIASASGAVTVDGDLLSAVGLTLVWFALGYAFFACAFGCAGALVPRLEELQASTTPLTLLIMISLFVAFAVNSQPDGTLAHVSAFIPLTAPMTLPPRILVGEAPWYEVLGGAIVTLAAAAALIPLAGRIYSGAVLRTGSRVKLRDAWRASAL
jgi:ABC-2 type transport system permease protein